MLPLACPLGRERITGRLVGFDAEPPQCCVPPLQGETAPAGTNRGEWIAECQQGLGEAACSLESFLVQLLARFDKPHGPPFLRVHLNDVEVERPRLG